MLAFVAFSIVAHAVASGSPVADVVHAYSTLVNVLPPKSAAVTLELTAMLLLPTGIVYVPPFVPNSTVGACLSTLNTYNLFSELTPSVVVNVIEYLPSTVSIVSFPVNVVVPFEEITLLPSGAVTSYVVVAFPGVNVNLTFSLIHVFSDGSTKSPLGLSCIVKFPGIKVFVLIVVIPASSETTFVVIFPTLSTAVIVNVYSVAAVNSSNVTSLFASFAPTVTVFTTSFPFFNS